MFSTVLTTWVGKVASVVRVRQRRLINPSCPSLASNWDRTHFFYLMYWEIVDFNTFSEIVSKKVRAIFEELSCYFLGFTNIEDNVILSYPLYCFSTVYNSKRPSIKFLIHFRSCFSISSLPSIETKHDIYLTVKSLIKIF